MNAATRTDDRPITVGDLMAAEPIVVRADASLTEAAQVMDEYDVSGLPVVAEGGAVIGVISETDLVRARATEWLWANWTGLHVRHLMSSPPLTIHASAPVAAAAIQMERDHVHRLVVVSDDDPLLPIGVISTSDLVRALAKGPR
jgi:CBS domain-containing protein